MSCYNFEIHDLIFSWKNNPKIVAPHENWCWWKKIKNSIYNINKSCLVGHKEQLFFIKLNRYQFGATFFRVYGKTWPILLFLSFEP